MSAKSVRSGAALKRPVEELLRTMSFAGSYLLRRSRLKVLPAMVYVLDQT